MPYRMTPSVRHRAIEVHYYYSHKLDKRPQSPKIFIDYYSLSAFLLKPLTLNEKLQCILFWLHRIRKAFKIQNLWHNLCRKEIKIFKTRLPNKKKSLYTIEITRSQKIACNGTRPECGFQKSPIFDIYSLSQWHQSP